jgi:glycosyltransferase involved in cell wall biosynthesis
MLGLAEALEPDYRTVFLSFAEGGGCRAFLREARRHGFEGLALENDTPHLLAAFREISARLAALRAQVLCCHGYKANLLGRLAARRQRIPVIAVSRGWTGESLRVRLYEAIDRFCLRFMDRVVCVSEGQADRVRGAGVPAEGVAVIRNAIRTDRFSDPDPGGRQELQALFRTPRSRIVVAAGRLSPEKGFGVLLTAARRVVERDPSLGFVLFGDGALRATLARQIQTAGLREHVILAGFRTDLDYLLPCCDLVVLPSFTEGLPNVILEAFAAGLPVVATAVGGTPEIVADGVNGYLVAPGDDATLARRILDALASEEERQAMGQRGRERVLREFTFEAQADAYRALFTLNTAGTSCCGS